MTNSLSFLPYVDRVIMLESGSIAEMGTYDELIKQKTSSSSPDSSFVAFVEKYLHHTDENENELSSNEEQNEKYFQTKSIDHIYWKY